MDEKFLKKYILIGIIVLVNVILLILTTVSVIKSVNRVASGQVSVSHTETNTESNIEQDTEELTDTQEEEIINEQNEDDINEGLSIGNAFSKVSKIKDYINMSNLLTCILLIIAINLAILAILIFRKLK